MPSPPERVPFDRLVAEHGPTVLRVCRAVLGPVDADDAWSETFLAALRAYPDLPAGANVQAWLVTIAHRKAIDQVRGARRRPIPLADPHETVDGRDRADRSDGEPHDDTIWVDVAALPPRQRQAIAYHYLGGLTFPEVAQVLGGTTDAARRAAHDGIRSLRAGARAGRSRAGGDEGE